jgi:RimJ/RimL family protein N-acetyltransferase
MIPSSHNLNFREIRIDDIPKIHELNSYPEVDLYNTLGIPESIKVTENTILPFIQEQTENPRNRYVYLVENKQAEFIGLIGVVLGKPKYFTAEIWYKIHPNFWNKGYATEMVKCVLSFCFHELKLHRVKAGCATKNIGSIRVLEKNGFIREGFHKKVLPIRGVWTDNYEFAILEEDYFKNNTDATRTYLSN